MEKDSALYQLMGVRMNGVMNGITNSDGEYQAILRKSDEYSGRLERMELPKEVRLLIDRYASKTYSRIAVMKISMVSSSLSRSFFAVSIPSVPSICMSRNTISNCFPAASRLSPVS